MSPDADHTGVLLTEDRQGAPLISTRPAVPFNRSRTVFYKRIPLVRFVPALAVPAPCLGEEEEGLERRRDGGEVSLTN